MFLVFKNMLGLLLNQQSCKHQLLPHFTSAEPRSRNYAWRGAAIAFVGSSVTFILASCSPGMFWSSDQDLAISNAKSYRRINKDCANIDLSSNTLDVATYKQMLACFNSNGALEPINRLTEKMSESELRPLVGFINEYVLNNKPLLYQLDSTYRTLEDQKILDSSLVQLGRVLENEDFISAVISVLKEGYTTRSLLFFPQADKDILNAIERIAQKLTPENFSDIIDAALTLASARAFSSLQTRFRGDSPNRRGLRQLIKQGREYFKINGDPNHVELGDELIKVIIDGKLFRVMDAKEVIGLSAQQILENVPHISSIFKKTLRTELGGDGRVVDAPLMNDITSLFHFLDRPIYCLKKTKFIPNANSYVIREIVSQNTSEVAEFIQRSQPLNLVVMNPFCEYPDELGEYYPALIKLADTGAIEPATDLIKTAYRNDLSELLIRVLSDTGQSNDAGIKLLLPILGELADRGAWDDLFFLLSLLRVEDRSRLVDTLVFLTEKVDSLGGKSLLDVFENVFLRVDEDRLYQLLVSLRRFTESNEPLLVPALTGLRRAYHVNDAHPLVDLIHEIMSSATRNEELFNTLFKLSEYQEFKDSIRLISEMSKDGRFKELSDAVLTLFHKFAIEGKTREIHLTPEPIFIPLRRHDFSMSDLGAVVVDEVPWNSDNPCRRLDTRIPMGDYNHAKFEEQLDNLLGCLNTDRLHEDVVTAVKFLRQESTSSGRQSFFNFSIDMIKSLEVDASQLGDLADRWIRAVDDGRFYHLMDALPFWLTHKVGGSGEPSGVAGPVIKPLLSAIQQVIRGAQPSIRKTLDYVAKVLRRDDFPLLLGYGVRLGEMTLEPVPAPMIQQFDLERIQRWVGNKECEQNPQQQIRRSQEIIEDYNNAATNWDLMPDHRPRYNWEKVEFKAAFEPLLQKFADPKQNAPDKTALQALLNVMGYFTLPSEPGVVAGPDNPQKVENKHYSPDYLAQWLRERSDDYRLITYFYPGDRYPRVRLVNSLDRLELVLINADFTFILPTNFGQQFLGALGNAWGDEPPEVWPAAVREKYPEHQRYCNKGLPKKDREYWAKWWNKCPKTLAQAYEELAFSQQLAETFIGYPRMPKCTQIANPNDDPETQRRETTEWPAMTSVFSDFPVPHDVKASIYNIRQVLSVIKENLPDSSTPNAGGMRVLRDLFYELYTSTPIDAQNPNSGWRNNLSVVTKMVRMGLTRQAALKLSRFPPIPSEPSLLSEEARLDYFAILNFFRAFIKGSTSPHILPILNTLIVDSKDHALIWKVIDQVFDVSDSPNNRYMKQLVFYFLAQAGDFITKEEQGILATQGKKIDIIDPALRTIGPVLDNYGGYLTRRAEKVKGLLESKTAAYWVRALYEDEDSEKKTNVADLLRDIFADAQRGLDAMAIISALDPMDVDPSQMSPIEIFAARADVIMNLEEYKRLKMDEIAKEVLHFFEEQPEDGRSSQSATVVRHYLADRLSSKVQGAQASDVEEILTLVQNKPDEFYQILGTTSRYIQNGELRDFIKHAKDAISGQPLR